jgi:3-deoxy-D-arabino-heptulosonate 7-phosphate (DAHP) synthase
MIEWSCFTQSAQIVGASKAKHPVRLIFTLRLCVKPSATGNDLNLRTYLKIKHATSISHRSFKSQSYDPNNFFLIAGPCVVESEELVMEVADKVSGICKRLEIPYVFKASYRKANRTSAGSFTGIGDDNGLSLIKKVGDTFHLPTTSDIHAHEEAAMAAPYIDILQIPAFLCRQTDLLIAAAETGKDRERKKRAVPQRPINEICSR